MNRGSLEKAKQYVKTQFEAYGYQTEEQLFEVSGSTYTNIICRYQVGEKKRLVIGAHYDVCGDTPGADDNASGIAGLLELARLIQEAQPELEYGIEFVAYTLEEPPFFGTDNMGSAIHAKSLYDNKVQVLGMICLEMIGYFTDAKESQRYPAPGLSLIYPKTGNFITVAGLWSQRKLVNRITKIMRKTGAIPVVAFKAPKMLPGIDFSDHRNYWKYDYEAVMITDSSFYRNPNYHQRTDTPDTLDYARMAEVVKGLLEVVQNYPGQ
jgi:Zn-dependent M28 family amino/carboxypeptidase